jgi:hypothetical protein
VQQDSILLLTSTSILIIDFPRVRRSDGGYCPTRYSPISATKPATEVVVMDNEPEAQSLVEGAAVAKRDEQEALSPCGRALSKERASVVPALSVTPTPLLYPYHWPVHSRSFNLHLSQHSLLSPAIRLSSFLLQTKRLLQHIVWPHRFKSHLRSVVAGSASPTATRDPKSPSSPCA